MIDISMTLDEAVRGIKHRPSMHPLPRHKTKVGPSRHELVTGGGRLHIGMRKYGYVDIKMVDMSIPMLSELKGLWNEHRVDEWQRIVIAFARYRKSRYARDFQNALVEAWRC